MKKLSVIFAVLFSMLIVLSACSSNNTTEESNKNESSNQASSSQSKSSETTETDVSVEALMSKTPNSESDFNAYESKYGGMIIDNYLGQDEIVVVPDAIKGKAVDSIHLYTFANDCNVKAICLPDSVKELGEGVFGNNSSLITVVLGTGIEELPTATFLNCKNLENVVLSEGLKFIRANAFGGCKSLKEISIPSTVEEIELNSFLLANENLIIKGKSGSCAETFAKENGFKFEAN